MKQTISIIIPTFNEAENIGMLIRYLFANFAECEIITADGGSTDDTVGIVSRLTKVVNSPKGRSIQMNTGANAATGNILWFLHADCIPPVQSVDLILDAFKDKNVVGGGFHWGLSGPKWYYGFITYFAHLKNKLKCNLFGDMGIFVRKDVFKRLNGYAEIPFLEDMDFNKRLKKMGKVVIFDDILWSFDRKLVEKGHIRTFLRNDFIKIAFSLGISPEYLMKFY